MVLKLIELALFTLCINIPFGWLREKTEKFSKKWFLYIHLPIPFIIALRIASGISIKFAPVLIAAAIIGQIAGSRARRIYESGGVYG